MAHATNRASLLGLPAELRLKIYDYANHTDINCLVLENVTHTSGPSTGTRAILIRKADANLALSIPWLNLRFSCKSIQSELDAFMTKAAFLNAEQNRTYTLDVEIENDDSTIKASRRATWRALPCPASYMQVLVMNVSASSEFGPWTEGGAASLARAVYQILNHLCHNGPQIITRHQLKDHMRFCELIINVDQGTAIKRENVASGCDSNPKFNYSLFANGLCQLARKGYMFGYVEKVKLCSDDGDVQEFAVQDKPDPVVASAWRNYGFGWGELCAA